MESMFADHSRIELSNRKILGQSPNIWKLKNKLLNDTWVKKEILREIFKYFELNENEYKIYHVLWEAVKAILRGKFIALNTYFRK